MRKNVSGQAVGCQLTTAADGTDFTGSASVFVTGDNGTQAAGGGTVTHEGNGYHSYAPTQAETNYDHIAFTFTGTGAVTATVQVYTRFDANLTHSLGVAVTNADGTATAGGATSITLAVGSSATDDFYNDNVIRIVGGTGAGQSRVVTDYVGSTRVATVGSAWVTNPDNTSQYVFEGNADVGSGSAPSAADIWSHATRTLTAATNITDTGGTVNVDALGNVTVAAMTAAALTQFLSDDTGFTVNDPVAGSVVQITAEAAWDAGRVPIRRVSDAANITSSNGTIPVTAGGLVSADVTAISTDVTAADNAESFFDGTGYAGTGNVLPWNPAWDAEVQSEVADALAAYDPPTRAELTADIATVTGALPANFGTLVISSGRASSDVKAVNGVTLTGSGTAGDPWGP